jgi:hypothetical protein
MSAQQATGIGVVLDLEELFLSREFWRKWARLVPTAPPTVVSAPAQLEQVFLSDVFGRPEVVAAAVRVVEESAPALSGQPTLVLLRGGGEGVTARVGTHPQRRAIAAVSGVAAAALAVAGLASWTGQGPGRAPVTEQAQSAPNSSRTGSGGGSQPGPVGPTALPNRSNTGTPVAPGGGGTNAALISFTTPVAAGSPQSSTGGGTATPPAAPAAGGGGSSPGTAPGSRGGGNVLTPALNVVGNEASSLGSSVSSTAGEVSQALPVTSVTQAVGSVATPAVNNLGGGSPSNILGVSKQ